MASSTTFSVPTQGEFAPFYSGYIGRVGDGAVIEQMEAQAAELSSLLGGLTDEAALARYAPGKWSVKEVVGHLADAERIFAYRALRIARGDATPLAGFDENRYVEAAGFDARPLAALLDEWMATRRSTIALFRSFDEAAIGRTGSANDVPVTVRALAYITVGHLAHHLEILRTRYFAEAARP